MLEVQCLTIAQEVLAVGIPLGEDLLSVQLEEVSTFDQGVTHFIPIR